MPGVVARTGARYVTMHSFGEPTTPHRYGDVVAEVRAELIRRAERLESLGVARDRIVLDPGLGFSKAPEENWALLRGAPELVATGYPVLIGTLAQALHPEDRGGRDLRPGSRDRRDERARRSDGSMGGARA